MQHFFKRAISLLCLLAILTVSFVSCGAGGNKERMNDTTDTLYVGHVGTSFPTSYMPWQSRDGIAPTLSSMIYSTLFSYDENTASYEPSLAKEWYYIAPDGTPLLTENGETDYDAIEYYYGNSGSYIPVKIILHENATWSDGTPVTAEDIYFTLDLCADSSRSNHAGALAWVSDLEHRYTSGIMTKQGIFTAEHPGKYTFTEEEEDTVVYLHTSKVLGAIASLFTTILILPRHLWQPVISTDMPANSTEPNEALRSLYQNPVGCGPFTLEQESSNAQVIVLNRREDYHMKDGDELLYKVDRIKFILYQEQNVAIFSILNGYIDVLDSSISPNYRTLFEKEDDMQVLEAGNSFVNTLVLNLNPPTSEQNEMRALLGNVEFRKALALAINQRELIQNVQSGAASTYSSGLVSSSMVDIYEPSADRMQGDVAERLKEANRLLDAIVPDKDEKGYRLLNGKRVSFDILTSPGEQDLVSFLQVQFQKTGIDVKFAAQGSSPENTYFYSGKFDMATQGVSITPSTADIMLKSHFVTMGKSSNYGRLNNAQLTAKIEEMRKTLNRNTKYDLLKEIQVLIAEQYYKIPLYSSNVISVARTDRYTGWISVEGGTAFTTESLQNLQRVNAK
ncbi:MAG: ABC transporter substrate-binding protein [Clostridia bacterium]|nr:ABC transporter substrate-binding protein [Clostridia bacterium]